jgi:hypothetical protein
MKKRLLIFLIPLVLLNLSCSLISGFISPGVVIRLAPDTTLPFNPSVLQETSDILKTRMVANLTGKYILQTDKGTELLAVLFDPNDVGTFMYIATSIGAVDFIDSVESYYEGDFIDTTKQKIILTDMDVENAVAQSSKDSGMREGCSGPNNLDTFFRVKRESFPAERGAEKPNKKLRTPPGSSIPETNGCAWSYTHPE